MSLAETGRTRWTRRRVLTLGLASAATAAAAGITGLELISRGDLPGKSVLGTLDGACSVSAPALEFALSGPSFSRTFYSTARRRTICFGLRSVTWLRSDRPGGWSWPRCLQMRCRSWRAVAVLTWASCTG